MENHRFVEFLEKEFKRKKAKNTAYSLRSFSRDLGIDVSNLSKILKRKKLIGPLLKKRLATKFGLSDSDLEHLSFASTTDNAYSSHGLEAFEVVSNPVHYAILETLKLKGLSPTPKQIAARLGLSLEEVRPALERLKKVGLMKSVSGKLMAVDESSSSILSVATSRAHREQQREILEGAVEALETVPIELRSQSSMTMAVDKRKLEEAKNLIKKFRRDLGRLMSSSDDLDEVYQLSISLYPVTLTQSPTPKEFP